MVAARSSRQDQAQEKLGRIVRLVGVMRTDSELKTRVWGGFGEGEAPSLSMAHHLV